MSEPSKRERLMELRLERRLLNRTDLLVLKRDLCNGCGLCIEICLKKALSMKPAVTEEGSLVRSPVIEVDETKCIFCGACAVICPLNAFEARVNNEKSATFVKNDVLPSLIKRIDVHQALCKPDCAIACETSCPREAIKVDFDQVNNQITVINHVHVDTDRCIYCKACEYACPYGVITVERPFEGSVIMERERCPPSCHICEDVCPSDAITNSNGELEVNKELCVFCKACQTVCPHDAIHVEIKRVSHTPIQSSTWINLLERLASYQAATKELASKSRNKQKSLMKTRIS